MNLAYVPSESIWSVEHRVSQQMAALSISVTNQPVQVKIGKAGGDGNCLFRSLSYCITGSRQQFGIMRGYTVNHMLNSQYHSDLEVTYKNRNRQSKKSIITWKKWNRMGLGEQSWRSLPLQISLTCQ